MFFAKDENLFSKYALTFKKVNNIIDLGFLFYIKNR